MMEENVTKTETTETVKPEQTSKPKKESKKDLE